MITLTNGATPLTLPSLGGMTWSDEFAWRKVESSLGYSITGKLMNDVGVKVNGQPITLECGDGNGGGWMSRADLVTLYGWAQEADQLLTLNLRGVDHSVRFHHAAGAIQSTPIIDYVDYLDDDYYAVTLRFLKV